MRAFPPFQPLQPQRFDQLLMCGHLIATSAFQRVVRPPLVPLLGLLVVALLCRTHGCCRAAKLGVEEPIPTSEHASERAPIYFGMPHACPYLRVGNSLTTSSHGPIHTHGDFVAKHSSRASWLGCFPCRYSWLGCLALLAMTHLAMMTNHVETSRHAANCHDQTNCYHASRH